MTWVLYSHRAMGAAPTRAPCPYEVLASVVRSGVPIERHSSNAFLLGGTPPFQFAMVELELVQTPTLREGEVSEGESKTKN